MMKKSRQILSAMGIVLCAFAFSSCGDEVRFTDSQTDTLEQNIYIVPEGVNGAVHLFYTPKKKVFLNINENVRIQAVYQLNGNFLDTDVATNYYQSLLWNIDGKKINIPNFHHSFHNPGEYDCILQTVDNFGDTLSDTTKIFVDTPSEISLTSPRNGFNQIDPFSDKKISLQWEVTGVDPWESAFCAIYGSNSEKDLWSHKIGSVACDDDVSIKGPLVPDKDELDAFKIDLSNSSITYYWGVIMTVYNGSEVKEKDTSNIFHFSTSLVDTDSSILSIPIAYKFFQDKVPPDTRITIVNIKGDTLSQIYSTSKKTTESIKLAAQTGVMVYVEEMYFDEYKAESFTVNIPEHSVINADTVFFEDKISPTVWPLNSYYLSDAPITFSILDKGSGVAPSKIDIHFDEPKEIRYTYSDTRLEVYANISKPMRIYIRAADNAGNQSAPLFWNLNPKSDAIYIEGPFINKEDLE
ncbi:MAG: hypothetical protein II892_03135 [Fibrobacter sp.]|nr:hypothetical protein [Fibrobacter sp.]MBQ3779093.1 hypothetical protein [Fibrobacter sp.]